MYLRRSLLPSALILALILPGGYSCKKEDSTPPVISLSGGSEIYLRLGEPWTDPGATAWDDTDGDLTASLQTAGAVDVEKVGHYQITYQVSDKAGNTAAAVRNVYVTAGLLTGPYHASDSVSAGANLGLFQYDITIDSLAAGSLWWQNLELSNFRDIPACVISLVVSGNVVQIPLQQLPGVPTAYEGKISGQGVYSASPQALVELIYHIDYDNGYFDDGQILFQRF